MADNVDITAGTGTTIATDQVGAVHYQRVKLVDGTLDSTTAIPGDATNGLDVDVTRVQGTVTVAGTVTADAGSGHPSVATDGSAAPATGIMQMGIDGVGNAQRILTTTAGELKAINMGWDPVGLSYVEVSVDPTLTDGETNAVSHLNVHSRTSVYNGTTWDRVRGDVTNGMDVDVTRVSGNVTVVQPTAGDLNATVTGTVTANLAAGVNNIGDVDVLTVPAPLSTTGGGTEATALRVTVATDSTGVLSVDDNGSTLSIDDGGGSITVDGAVSLTGISDIEGSVAHASADSGFPVKIGTRARSTVITSVATDNRSDAIGTLQGYIITYPYALPQSSLTGTANTTAATDTAVIAAQGAGVTINVTTITVYNSSTTNTFVNIKDGATTRLVIPAPAQGGATITLPSPLRLTANTALNFASASAVTTMYCSVVGFAGI